MKTTWFSSVLATALMTVSMVDAYPAFTIKSCSSSGCTAQSATIIWDKSASVQPTAAAYAEKGASISGDSLKLVMKDGNGPRVYLGSGNSAYKMVQMVGKELTYDIETSSLSCNMNGALYFIQMKASDGATGGGYCDANGVGGSYCPEMDIWEANKYATVMTVHPSSHDSSGCGYNPYAKGSKSLYGYGSGFSVDTSKPFTVVTQFRASGSQVTEIRRIYQQNGKTIQGGSLGSSCNVAAMGSAMAGGSVLAFSLWSSDGMDWLDAGANGPCPTGTNGKSSTLTFSNIRIGDIGTTTSGTSGGGGGGSSTTTPTRQPSTTTTRVPSRTNTTRPSSNNNSNTIRPSNNNNNNNGNRPSNNNNNGNYNNNGNSNGNNNNNNNGWSNGNNGWGNVNGWNRPNSNSNSNRIGGEADTADTSVVYRWHQCGGNGYTGPTQCVSGSTCQKQNDYYSYCN